MRLKLLQLAKACDRRRISDCGAASLATAVLCDVDVVSTMNTSKVTHRSIVRRARDLRDCIFSNTQHENIQSIVFNDKKMRR